MQVGQLGAAVADELQARVVNVAVTEDQHLEVIALRAKELERGFADVLAPPGEIMSGMCDAVGVCESCARANVGSPGDEGGKFVAGSGNLFQADLGDGNAAPGCEHVKLHGVGVRPAHEDESMCARRAHLLNVEVSEVLAPFCDGFETSVSEALAPPAPDTPNMHTWTCMVKEVVL